MMESKRSIMLLCLLVCSIRPVINGQSDERFNQRSPEQEEHYELIKGRDLQADEQSIETELLDQLSKDSAEVLEERWRRSQKFNSELPEKLLFSRPAEANLDLKDRKTSLQQISSDALDRTSNTKLNTKLNTESNAKSNAESNTKSNTKSNKESNKESNTESTVKSNAINDRQENKCEKYHFDCEGCLGQKNCVYCWMENACVRQQHQTGHSSIHVASKQQDRKNDSRQKSDQNDNHVETLTERPAIRLTNSTILVQQFGTVRKDTCPQLSTLGNISASSCTVNELTLLWLMFTSGILSVTVLFGCLFYCCVFKKSNDMIIITSDKDNFLLIDEE